MDYINIYKNRILDYSKPVRVYRNLARKGIIYSIKQGKLVVGHTEKFILIKCKFIVNKYGKDRAITTQVRNVHAFIEGMLVNKLPKINTKQQIERVLCYKPFEKQSFYVKYGNEIHNSPLVYTDKDKIKVLT